MNSKDLGIIIAGAGGRMGKTIASLIENSTGLRLAGALETGERLKELAGLPCPASADLASLIKDAPDSVIVDFTAPAASIEHARIAAAHSAPIVIGTTGFDEGQKRLLAEYAAQTPLLWSANMSVGVNVLAHILPMLAASLGESYDIEMMEIHHRRKKDAPSGTALMLGEALAGARGWKLEDVRNSCRDGIIGARPDRELGIQALRGGDVVGVHEVFFFGPGEVIEITHRAESRENFAQGALRAARWLADQPKGPVYSMRDVIRLIPG